MSINILFVHRCIVHQKLIIMTWCLSTTIWSYDKHIWYINKWELTPQYELQPIYLKTSVSDPLSHLITRKHLETHYKKSAEFDDGIWSKHHFFTFFSYEDLPFWHVLAESPAFQTSDGSVGAPPPPWPWQRRRGRPRLLRAPGGDHGTDRRKKTAGKKNSSRLFAGWWLFPIYGMIIPKKNGKINNVPNHQPGLDCLTPRMGIG